MKQRSYEYIRTTRELARRLGVTRRTVGKWQQNPDAPKRDGRWWHFPSWIEYISSHRLGRFTLIERSEAASEVADLLRNRLPARVPKALVHKLADLLEALLLGMFGSPSDCEADHPLKGDDPEGGEHPQNTEPLSPGDGLGVPGVCREHGIDGVSDAQSTSEPGKN